MTDSFVTLPVVATTSGNLLDADSLIVAGTTVLRERQRIAGANATDLAPVTSSGGLSVNVTGGSVVVSSLTSGTIFQGVTPWTVVASSTGGPQPVVQSASPWLVVSSTTGGNAPVLLQNTLPLSVVASTTGGAQPVAAFQGTFPYSVSATTTGGAIAVVGVQDSRQTFTATSTSGQVSVSATLRNVATVIFSASSGAASGIALIFEGTDDSVNWYPMLGSRSSDGFCEAAPSGLSNATAPRAWDIALGGCTNFRVRQTAWVSGLATVAVDLESMPYEPAPGVAQGTIPWQVVASTTGGAQQVVQSTTPWLVVSSTTGGSIATLSQTFAIVRATQPTAIADAAQAQAIADTKGRLVVTPNTPRQLITQQFLQVTATGETVLFAGTSGTYHDLLWMMITAATSNIVGSAVTIKDSSGGATQFRCNVSAGGSGGGEADVVLGPFSPAWKHSTATSTGSAWTVNFSIAGTYNVSAMFMDWTS